MDQLLVVTPIALLVLCAVVSLLRLGGSAARYWAVGWMVLFLNGVFSGFSLESVVAQFGAQLWGLGFAVATLLGARALNGHETPRWVPVGALVFGVLLMLLNLSRGYAGVSSWVSFIQAPLLVAAAISIWRGASGRRPLELGLATVLIALAANEMLDVKLIESGNRLLGLGIWITLGLSTAILQVGALADRARQGSESALEDLAAERVNLLDMLDAVPVGILLEDRDGYVRLINPTLAEQLALQEAAQWTGRHASELVKATRPRFAPDSAELLEKVRFTNPLAVPRDMEVHLQPPNERTLLVSVLPIDPRSGRSRGRVWVSHDVTDERRMAETLQEAERMETVGTLAGGLAHDFNNQLTAILGNASLLRRDLPDAARPQQMADDLVRSAEHCAELTAGLLAFARRGPTAQVPVDVRAVFAAAERLLRPSLDHGLHLEISVDEATPPVAADESEFRRVVTNLLLNATQAVGPGGTIRVSAAPRPGGVEIVVSDDGVGIEPAAQSRIFDPFFTTKEKSGGTGLGLSIVYGIVQAHGAEIEVESGVGVGTTFRVRWPAAVIGRARSDRPSEPADSAVGGATILVAEDEAVVRRLVCEVLRGAGYRVVEAEDGLAAARVLRQRAGVVDLALLDLSMPGATGLDALAEMRTHAPDLPAIIMSGHPTREGAGSWPDDVPLLKKPCAPDTLLAEVRRMLGLAASGSREAS